MSADLDLAHNLRAIRHALHIGLESFGEIERIIDQYETLATCGAAPDESLKPLHPTGAPDTIGVFATALRIVETMDMVARQEVSA